MSTPSWIVLASVCAGSTCAKRARSSSASTRRCIRSACARCHRSVRSLTERFLKLSYSAASRRYLSFSSASSPSRRTTASSGSSPSAPSGAGAGGSTAPGCCAGCGCSALCFMGFRFTKQSLCRPRRAVVTGNSLSHTKLAARTARVNSPAHPRSARDVAVDERYAVSQRLLALRVVEDLVVHLRIPPHLDRTAQPVGERAGQVRVHHAVLAREQERQGRLDAVAPA